MKTTVFFKRIFLRPIIFILIVAYLPALQAQSGLSASASANGPVFKKYSVKSGIDLKNDDACFLKTVTAVVDAIVSIDDLMNIAFVKKMVDSSRAPGFIGAFQPVMQIVGKGVYYTLS